MPVNPESPDEQPEIKLPDDLFVFDDAAYIENEFKKIDRANNIEFQKKDTKMYNDMVEARAFAMLGGGVLVMGSMFTWISSQEWLDEAVDIIGTIAQGIGGITLAGGATGSLIIQMQRKRKQLKRPEN